ncbi:transcription factor DIVARICATA-like [Cornus florida]|uniref:transcription factor DIVARICATA-like n=1 Tax=Cornus florida TaxID=4283 RepID=UPI0028A0A700|nr:transcription factor DIVARICATA-like [Cornus florida]
MLESILWIEMSNYSKLRDIDLRGEGFETLVDMESLSPSSYLNCLMQESKNTKWTKEENKSFERALAMFDKDTPERWLNVAAMIPGKSVFDVIWQYQKLEADVNDIEAGLVPIPVYLTSSFTLEFVDNREFDALRKRSSTGERKKGVPWTEDEHRRFLMGLEVHGKGDWRHISRNFVITKNPTQVASHAQKYYMRQNSGGKDKRRPSIHDITTIHLADATQSNYNESLLCDKSSPLSPPTSVPSTPKILLNWNDSNDGVVMVFGSTHANSFMQYPHEIAPHGLKLQGGARHGAHIGPHNSMFQIQSTSVHTEVAYVLRSLAWFS